MIQIPKSQLLQAISRVVPRGNPVSACVADAVMNKSQGLKIDPQPQTLSTYPIGKSVALGAPRVSSSIGATTQVRFAHTDLKVPDFTAHRKDDTKDPTVNSKDTDLPKKLPNYMVIMGLSVPAVYAAKSIVRTLIGHWDKAADVLALSTIEVKLDTIPEGKSMTFMWRGKPLFVRHRTDEEIERETATDLSKLRDPEADADRIKDPKFLVVIGICTHLGCVPIANAGDYGGYYCPCHGSHYDGSGRIRQGPAPLNLEIPPYQFNDNVLVVG